jgi:SecD/SecF fusion protein
LAFAGEELRVAQLDAAAIGAAPAASRCATKLQFEQRVTRDTLLESLSAASEAAGVPDPSWSLTGPDGQADSAAGFRSWNVEANSSTGDLSKILAELKSNLESRPAWLSSSKIGGKVAGDARNKAIAAILISLVCIVGYLWIRFQRVIFGLSAVVALVHDVLITLGAIAMSAYLAKSLGVLMIDEFKISLPVVAAFLTIIGYSLNDTIVVFDRIREVRGRSPDITEEMINTSINQTLSRTILTSLTTLIVVMILYVFGGQGIHGFAFALLVGVVVGTYSSIFVASPALLWMSKLQHTAGEKNQSERKASAAK